MPALGIGYNPTLINQNLDTSIDDGNQWYENIDKSTTRLVPSQNPNNYGSTFGISMNQNFGIPNTGMGNQFADARGLMTSNNAYRGLFPGQRNIHKGFGTADVSSTFTPPEKTGILQSIFNNTMVGRILGNFKDNPQEAFNRGYFNTVGTGQVAGNPTRDLFAGKNVSYMSDKGLEVGGQKRIDRIDKTIADWEEAAAGDDLEAAEIAKERLRTTTLYERRKTFQKQLDDYNAQLAAKLAENKKKIEAPSNITTGDTTRDTGGWTSSGYSTRGGFTGKADPTSGQVRGHHGAAQGGRIGYNRGRVVNPGGYQGDEEFEDENTLEFMQDQGVPHSEMAETSPFEMRIQELMDEGMSWQEAYQIASEEFGQIAEGEGDSFSEEGLASLV